MRWLIGGVMVAEVKCYEVEGGRRVRGKARDWECQLSWIVAETDEPGIWLCVGGWARRRRRCQKTTRVVNSLGAVACGSMPRPAPGVLLKKSYTYRGYRLGR